MKSWLIIVLFQRLRHNFFRDRVSSFSLLQYVKKCINPGDIIAGVWDRDISKLVDYDNNPSASSWRVNDLERNIPALEGYRLVKQN